MKLLVTGVSHKTAPVEVRERLAFREELLPDALARLSACEGIEEALIFSTCNRVEIMVSSGDDADPDSLVSQFLRQGRPDAPLEPHIYQHHGKDAIHHVFRVAASLDSMVVGEPQVLGQLKRAYTLARQQGTLTGVLENVLSRAFSVAKRVRSETGIGQMAVSVSFAAVELARKIFGAAPS
jgi:glutamyl-tRNA reductase